MAKFSWDYDISKCHFEGQIISVLWLEISEPQMPFATISSAIHLPKTYFRIYTVAIKSAHLCRYYSMVEPGDLIVGTCSRWGKE